MKELNQPLRKSFGTSKSLDISLTFLRTSNLAVHWILHVEQSVHDNPERPAS